MNCELRDYQIQCLESIKSKISLGAKRLSVAMPIGFGSGIVALALAEYLKKGNENEVAIVCKRRKKVELLREEIVDFQCEFDAIFILEDWYDCKKNFDYIIFMDLGPYDRLRVCEILKSKGATTISFSCTPPLAFFAGNKKNEQNNESFSFFEVFVTNKVLDVQDVRYSDESEVAYVKKWRDSDNRAIERKISKILDELKSSDFDVFKKVAENDKPSKINELQTLKRENADLRKKLQEISNQLEKTRVLCSELTMDIELLKRGNEYFNSLLYQVGFNPNDIFESFLKIENLRMSLKKQLEGIDEEQRELAQKQLQDKTILIVNALAQKTFEEKDISYFKDVLEEELTTKVWNSLSNESRSFLITAKSTFAIMSNKSDGSAYDYSGVCLLVTKALEVEVTIRFLSKYKDFLASKYNDEPRIPKFIQRYNEEKFTLGNVIHLLGVTIDTDKNCLKWDDSQEKDEFLDFAQKKLFDLSKISGNKVEEAILLDCEFIEKTRKDYRNPSAHKGALTMIKARECIEYVIDVQKMLKNMLSPMKF